MRPCCSLPIWPRQELGEARDRQVQRVPVAVLHRLPEHRLRIVGARNLAADPVDRREDLADRLAEGVRGVLHARGLLRKAAVPRVGAAQPAVIDAGAPPGRSARTPPRSPAGTRPGCSSPARWRSGTSHSQPEAIASSGRPMPVSATLTWFSSPDHEHRQQPEREAGERRATACPRAPSGSPRAAWPRTRAGAGRGRRCRRP